MPDRVLSTGQAAKLCSVTRDTVLKWIKMGKIDAVQTPGGHYRIKSESLRPYISLETKLPRPKIDDKPVSYCWEYHSKDGELTHNCRRCMVFKSQAQKCFLMAGLGEKAGPAGVHCKDNCYDCEYFHFISEARTNVLLVTDNENLIKEVKANAADRLVLKTSSCEYDTSAIVHDFTPDFIIVDDSLRSSNPDEICRHLVKDPRIKGAQIILAVPENRKRQMLQEGVCASMTVPFTTKEMEDGFLQLRRSLWGAKERR